MSLDNVGQDIGSVLGGNKGKPVEAGTGITITINPTTGAQVINANSSGGVDTHTYSQWGY